MSSLRSKLATLVYRALGSIPVAVPDGWAPTLLVGCGRSGTTITTHALGRHPAILALNEPRHIWRSVDQRADVWQEAGSKQPAKIVFDRSDLTLATTRRCRRTFFLRATLSGRQYLVEKLPINNFRLDWIDGVFPAGRFLNLIRDGRHVALSIERQPNWFGHGDQKWEALCQLARTRGMPPEMIQVGDDSYRRGLLEWTLSVEHTMDFFSRKQPERVLHVRYEQLLASPREEFTRMLNFIGVPFDPCIVAKMAATIARPAGPLPDESAKLPHPRTLALLEELGYR